MKYFEINSTKRNRPSKLQFTYNNNFKIFTHIMGFNKRTWFWMIIDAKEMGFTFFNWHGNSDLQLSLNQLKYNSPFGIAEHRSLNKIWQFPYNVRGDAGRCLQMANNRRNSMTRTATTTVVVVVVHLTLRHTFAADDNNKMMMMWYWWTIPTLKFTLAVFLDKHFFPQNIHCYFC